MRLLFVSSTTGGGSGRSQRELARRLIDRGHDITFLVDDKRPARWTRWVYEQCSDLAVRWGDRPGHRALVWFEGLPGRKGERQCIDDLEHLVTPIPQNAFVAAVEGAQPQVVVGNSLVRLTWREVREECSRRDVPAVLYVREVATYGHLDVMDDPADALVANASSLVERVETYGHSCALVPSVIDTSVTRVESDRSVALLINPIASHGIELLWEIARRLPDVSFVVQESWPLDDEQRVGIEREAARLSNVEFRHRTDPGPELYAKARLLLVPHQLDNRPRVVAEAQANGIPVIASDYPGLREAVGEGGVILGGADVDAWVQTIAQVWGDDGRYGDLCDHARRHGNRVEIDPDRVVTQFEAVLETAITRNRDGRPALDQR